MAEGRATKEKVICCAEWMRTPTTRRDRWEWQVIHQLSHSSVPFSLATFTDLAKLPVDRAAVLLHDARQLKWVGPAGPDCYVGRLKGRR